MELDILEILYIIHWLIQQKQPEENVDYVLRSREGTTGQTSIHATAENEKIVCIRPWQDSNLQSPAPEAGALSIRPQGRPYKLKMNLSTLI
jgi:hypothetical protein